MWLVLSTSCVITTVLCCVGIGLYKLTILYPMNILPKFAVLHHLFSLIMLFSVDLQTINIEHTSFDAFCRRSIDNLMICMKLICFSMLVYKGIMLNIKLSVAGNVDFCQY